MDASFQHYIYCLSEGSVKPIFGNFFIVNHTCYLCSLLIFLFGCLMHSPTMGGFLECTKLSLVLLTNP